MYWGRAYSLSPLLKPRLISVKEKAFRLSTAKKGDKGLELSQA